MDKLPLSVAIIALNEADRIAGALRSVPRAAELIVLDSGSTDDTRARAEALGARVIATDWPGHVAQKNRALEHCSQPWILCLDADEALDAEAAEALEAIIQRDGPETGWWIQRWNRWEGALVRGGSFGPQWHLRLIRRGAGSWGAEDPHDQLRTQGTTGRLRGRLLHDPYRSLGEHLSTIDRYSQRFVEVSLERGRRARVWDWLLRPGVHFVQSWLLRGGFRDGVRGWLLATLGASHVALKWGRLWLAQR